MLPSQVPGRWMVGGDDRRRPPAVAAGNGVMALATSGDLGRPRAGDRGAVRRPRAAMLIRQAPRLRPPIWDGRRGGAGLLPPAATMASHYRQGAGAPAIALPMHRCYPSWHDPSWHAYRMAKRPDASSLAPVALWLFTSGFPAVGGATRASALYFASAQCPS
jgi:hypothetical protein